MESAATRAPLRTCIACGRKGQTAELLAWFEGPDGQPWPDWTGRRVGRVGRHAWTCRTLTCVQESARKRAFARSWKKPVDAVPSEVLVARALAAGEEAWLNRLGLARRARALCVGQRAVRDEARGDARGVMVIAEDVGCAAKERFAIHARTKGYPVAWVRSGTWLGKALGVDEVGVLFLKEGTFASTLWHGAVDLVALHSAEIVAAAPASREAPRGSMEQHGHQVGWQERE